MPLVGNKVELKLGSTWTDVTSYVRGEATIGIRRGQSGEAGSVDPSEVALTLNNRDGRFSAKNPLGPYYGLLGRNTPLRVSVDQGGRSLDLLGLSTSRAVTPDNAAIELAFDVDWRIDLAPDAAGWRRTRLATKYQAASDQRSWRIDLSDEGGITLTWSQDGVALRSASSTAGIDTTQKRLAIRVVQQGDNLSGGTNIWFYTAPTIGGSYTQLGAMVTVAGGTASWFNSTAPLELGNATNADELHGPGFTGRVYGFQLRTGIAASVVVANPDFTAQAEGTTAFTDAAGRSWTITGGRITPSNIRGAGEMSSWPPRWDSTGRDVYVPIEAGGVLRRIQQGDRPVESTLYRGITETAPLLRAYWPCEDGTTADSISAGIPGVAPMQLLGTPKFAENSDVAASRPIPELNDSQWTGVIPAHEGSGAFQVRWIQVTPSNTATGNEQSICKVITSGTASVWHLAYITGGGLRVQAFDSDGTLLHDPGVIPAELNGSNKRISFEFTQNGSNIDWRVSTLHAGGTILSSTATLNNQTIGKGRRVVFNNGGGIIDLSIGHISYQSTTDSLAALADELNAWRNETAAARLERLCGEAGLGLRIQGDGRDTALMGYQWPGNLADLLRECAEADGGLLADDREALGLVYRTRTSLYNRPTDVTLDYSADDLGPGSVEPTDDDQRTRNDITAQRDRGGSARAEQTTGALSVLDPPLGAGRYAESVTLSLASDADTPDQAGWRLRLGTVDEMRWPTIPVHLGRTAIASDAALLAALIGMDVGARIDITNVLAGLLQPGAVEQILIGYTETLSNMERQMSLVCVPAAPYDVAVLDAARYASSGSTLNSGVTSSATSLSVATAAGPLWTTAAGDMPIPILVGGERMTVTAIAGASSPQTMTVTRSVNGVVKAHSAGAALTLAEPSYRAL